MGPGFFKNRDGSTRLRGYLPNDPISFAIRNTPRNCVTAAVHARATLLYAPQNNAGSPHHMLFCRIHPWLMALSDAAENKQ